MLVRPTPQSLSPGSVAKALKPPSKPVAAPILAQDWAPPESGECPSKNRDCPDRPGQLGPITSPGHLPSQPRPPRSWSGTPHSTQSTSHSPHSRSEVSSSSTSSHPGQDALKPAGGSRCQPSACLQQLCSGLMTTQAVPLGNGKLGLPQSPLC